MMGWTQNKHSFYVMRFSNVLVAPGSCGTTIVISSMWTDDCFDLMRFEFLFGFFDVCGEFGIEFVGCVTEGIRLLEYQLPAWRACLDCLSIIMDNRGSFKHCI